jgi:tRNA (guanosine-2'-O-)-methyltransferase
MTRRRKGAAIAMLAAIASLASCGPRIAASAANAANATKATLDVTNVSAPDGSSLTQACTPTGPELCFNAIDDNCNGVIDEGCGAETGILQFTIAWGDSPADVNLTVTTPAGERIPSEHARASDTGFRAGRDCPGDDGCGGQSVENVAYDGLEPPRGHYAVEVTLGELHGAETPVKVRFGARLGARVVGFDVELSPGDDARKTFAFDLP